MEPIVKGMTCGHCEAAVQRTVKRVAPRAEVVVERDLGRVSMSGSADSIGVESAIMPTSA